MAVRAAATTPWRAVRARLGVERGPPPALWLPALLVGAACAVPPAYLLARAAQSPEAAWEALRAGSTLRLAWNTAALAAAATALATALALPIAWLTARTDLPARRLLGVLAALPLAIPSYIAAMLALSAFGPRGLLQEGLAPLGVERLPPIYGLPGAAAVIALGTYPYLLLTLRPAVAGLDPRLEELSRGFGHGRLATFGRVVLPQLRPALAAGGLLVALYAISDFGAVALLRHDTLTLALFARYEAGFDLGGAAALALALAGLALALVAFEMGLRRRTRYHAAHGSGRAARTAPPVRLGRWRWPSFAFVAAVLALALATPVGLLGYWLARGVAGGEALRGVAGAAGGSLLAAGLAACCAAAAAYPIAMLAARHRRFPLTRPLEALSYGGFALPGLVVALALVFAALETGVLYQSLALLVFAYALLFLPQAVGASRVALLQLRPSMEEAARGLGRGPWRVLASITLPLTARGVLAGAALVFLTSMKELPATLLLSPIGYETLATRVWSASSEAFFARAALPALALIALSALPLALIALARRDA